MKPISLELENVIAELTDRTNPSGHIKGIKTGTIGEIRTLFPHFENSEIPPFREK